MPVSHSNLYTPCLKKSGPLLFYDNSSKSGIIIKISVQQKWTKFQFFFTVKFRKDLQEKLELKLPSPLKSALPCEKQAVRGQIKVAHFTAQLIQFKVMKTFSLQ